MDSAQEKIKDESREIKAKRGKLKEIKKNKIKKNRVRRGDFMQKERNEIEAKYKWDIDKMYEMQAAWEEDFRWIDAQSQKFAEEHAGFSKSGDKLLRALKDSEAIQRKLQNVFVYARMKKDEDNTLDQYQSMTDRAQSLMAKVSARMAFFQPELIAAGREKIMGFVQENEALKIYTFKLEETFRNEAHTLSESEEVLISKFQEVLSASDDIFTMLNNADMDFGTIKGENGEEQALTHGSYGSFIESSNRAVRKSAFEGIYAAYKKQKNTIATTFAYSVKGDCVIADVRKFDSALAAGLHSDNIPKEVYLNLVSAVNDSLPVLQKYLEIRRKILNLDKLHMYDMYVPLVESKSASISYEDALTLMYKALAPLGTDYIENVKKGVSDGWIDVYENKGKTSGAYSFGTYESMPYILLNYQDRLRDAFTLVHEMGHSMHSYYTRGEQPFVYGGHSIFTAEVASTVNEMLLTQYLLENAKDKEEKLYLINMYLEGFRTTLFRQTMFAEFELLVHAAVENGEVLTGDYLCSEYAKLNQKYFGENVVVDDNIAMEWARIPHFYSAFYVYKYATGYSAANAIARKIKTEGESAVQDYIAFLKSGKSNYPVELLKIAGVDMSEKKPIELAMEIFKELVDEFEKTLEE